MKGQGFTACTASSWGRAPNGGIVVTTSDSIGALADLMRQGLAGEGGSIRGSLEALFGDRYHKNAAKEVKETGIRDAYGVARADGDGVPYAGLINPDNPPSGPYGGCSVGWFPSEHGSVIGFSVGTRGLHPDEGILTRPGHRRRIAALRRYLASRGVTAWSKSDPTALAAAVPRSVVDALPEYSSVFRRYPGEMYCVARVPDDALLARTVVASFFDVYAYERGWAVLKAHQDESNTLLGALRGSLFVAPTVAEVNSLLRDRRFVILQGPPGTGKTRLA
jgi:5-methylcytosine-specific restriction protein B